ncbi:PilN domain-containing protein [Collimonas arenae]|nr:PilN domain-containing protein [Collimonas arenae]
MSQIRIDFAPHSMRRMLTRTSALTWIAALFMLIFCLGSILMACRLNHQNQTRQTEISGMRKQLDERDARKALPQKRVIAESQVNAINTATIQLNLPWRDLFDAVEVATPNSIALLSLEPDAKRQSIKGLAEAKNGDDMIAYVEELKQRKFFQSVVLLRHEINERDVNKPLRFQFQAQWGDAQ